ncbi:MAG: PAS domain-containing protein [Steroidobacteraceae bacterium]
MAIDEGHTERANVISGSNPESVLRLVLQGTNTGLWTWNMRSDAVTWSPECYALLGLAPDKVEPTGGVFFDLIHPDDLDRFQQAIATAIEQRVSFHCEFRVVTNDTTKWLENRGRAQYEADGTPFEMIGTVTDITERKLAEQRQHELLTRLEESEARHTSAMMAGGLAAWEYDVRTGRNVWDEHLSRLMGVPADSAAPMADNWLDFVHPGDRPRVEAEFQAALNGAEQFVSEFRVRRLDGAVRWFASVAAVLRAPDGSVTRVAGVVQDLTERHTAAEKLARADAQVRAERDLLAQLLDAIPIIVTRYDASVSRVLVNRQFTATLGWTSDDLLRQSAMELCYPDPAIRAEASAFMERVNDGWREVPTRTKDGRVRQVLWSNIALGSDLRVGVGVDVTEQRNVEQQLETLIAQLKEADRQKDAFLATLSHELRNPLAPILTAAQLLGSPAIDQQKAEWARTVIQRQVRHLGLLLDDLLDAARVTQNKVVLKRTRVDIASVVDAAVESARPLIDRYNHRLVISLPAEPPLLDGDPLRLAQVFANLLTNAAKYTDPGGRIELTAAVTSGALLLEVHDNGMGISAAERSRIFTMFAQLAGTRHRSEGGLGIGLALVKGLVELHGGSVAVHSAGQGQGSTFSVRLPLPTEAGEDAATTSSAHQASSGCRILVADDSRDGADALCLLLELSGHDVRVAYDGVSALALAQSHRPAVAIIDIGMPDLDGYGVARALRAEPWGRSLLLIAMTGWGQDSDKAAARQAGFDEHLTKPVDPGRLEQMVATRQDRTG